MKITKGSLSKRQETWLWRFCIDGERKSKTFTVKTKQQAESLRDAYIRKFQIAPDIVSNKISVAEVCQKYIIFAASYYRVEENKRNTTYLMAKDVAETVQENYGTTLAVEFGPLLLKEIRSKWVSEKITRGTVNRYTDQVKRIFKWAASEELIPSVIYNALCTVEGLRRGKSEAIEGKARKPVPQLHIDAIKPNVPRQIWALIQLQLLTGARPSELLKLRTYDIDTGGEVWTIVPNSHKTDYQGKSRVIYLGPKAQEIIKPFMKLQQADSFLFSPKEALAEHHAKKETHRSPKAKPNTRKTSRKVGNFYTPDSYRRAIEYACDKAKVPRWTPYQLRHNAGTYIRKHYGLEAAQIILGHSKADITQIYAERDQEKALKVIGEIG